MDQNSQTVVWIKLKDHLDYLNFNAFFFVFFFSSLDNLLQDAYIIFEKGVDNFEIEHKTY